MVGSGRYPTATRLEFDHSSVHLILAPQATLPGSRRVSCWDDLHVEAFRTYGSDLQRTTETNYEPFFKNRTHSNGSVFFTPKHTTERMFDVTNNQAHIKQDAHAMLHIKDNELIRRFTIPDKHKTRTVNDPHPELKAVLKEWNVTITAYYEEQLRKENLTDVAHAYLPNKSIRTNAEPHKTSMIIQFDFTKFYDHCRYEYIVEHLQAIDPMIEMKDENVIKRCIIDPHTNGVTQGLPVSGALAGLCLIPFWKALKTQIDPRIRFTQYSDDLTFSHTGKRPATFTVDDLTEAIYTALQISNRVYQLNESKTRKQHSQYRKVTGIRINHLNQLTPARNDYYKLRHILHKLSKTHDTMSVLHAFGYTSKNQFVGKVSYMTSIDETGKINRLIMKYADTCEQHKLFKRVIKEEMEKRVMLDAFI